MGKTTIAAAFADMYKAQADLVWWVRADQDSTIIDDLFELAERVGVPAADTRTETAQRTVIWLTQTDKRWLVVFDNADDERLLAPWVPKSGNGMSLITTRNNAFNQLGKVLDIGSLPVDVATEFLIDRVSELNAAAAADRPAATEVAKRLQGLPLALEQAGAWVASSGLNTFGRYLTLLMDVTKNPFPDGTVPLEYERSTWDAIQISVNAAVLRSVNAERLLRVMGWLAPDDIAVTWLTGAADLPYLNLDEELVIEALQALEQFSLIVVERDHVNVHRVVQAFARRTNDAVASGAAAVAVLGRQRPETAWEPAAWPVLRRLDPHAEHCLQLSAGLPDSASDLWSIQNRCALGVQHGGDPIAAVARFKTNHDLANDHFGERHPDTLTARANLASSYRSAGRTSEAITLEERVLVDRVEVLGERHPDTLTARANLAGSYWSAGRTSEAITLEERVLVDRVKFLVNATRTRCRRERTWPARIGRRDAPAKQSPSKNGCLSTVWKFLVNATRTRCRRERTWPARIGRRDAPAKQSPSKNGCLWTVWKFLVNATRTRCRRERTWPARTGRRDAPTKQSPSKNGCLWTVWKFLVNATRTR